MKVNFFKKCAALVIAVSVLSTGLTANAAQNSSVHAVQQAYGDSEWLWPAPAETQVPYDQYLSALLDVLYRNDSQAFVALGLGTAEDAAQIYSDNLDIEYFSEDLAESLGVQFPEALENDLLAHMARLIGSARYAVAGCELQADGTYEVTVIYEQLQIFQPLMKIYRTVLSDMITAWLSDYASYPGDEEMTIQVLAAFCSSLKVCLDNPVYAEPALTTVTIEPYDGAYIPNTDDIYTLELLFFDTDTVLNYNIESLF